MKVPGRIVAGALFALLLSAPLVLDRYWVDVLNSIGLYAILGLSLNIILGYAGMFHMGHAAFYAIGAYDLLKGFETAGKNFGRPIEMYLTAAVLYFIICFSLSYVVKRLHKKIAIIR